MEDRYSIEIIHSSPEEIVSYDQAREASHDRIIGEEYVVLLISLLDLLNTSYQSDANLYVLLDNFEGVILNKI